MSRLNAVIKLLFCFGEMIIVLASFVFLVGSGLVSMGHVAALSFPAARETAVWVLVISSMMLLCTCFGCLGTIRQTLKRGYCSGRRMLFMHQIIVSTVLIFSVSRYEWLAKREQSMKFVISNHTLYPYDAFERRISTYFNNAYFDSLCSDDTSTKALLDFVDLRCPDSMGRKYCALPERKGVDCDTSCDAAKGSSGPRTVDLMICCPSEELCKRERDVSCPYHRCRVEILQELHHWAAPTLAAARFVITLMVLILILSCLLICYNPRDEIEVELLKTGVLSAEDVEAILGKSNNVVMKRGSTIDAESLEKFKEMQIENKSRGYSRRRRMDRVSPTSSIKCV
ncbi:hypothetical protein ACHAXA_002641 [Cyclostephanos tholiformis]|jgi:hypothetical protein|uniref:Tetraspanin n=1 Tax=Cyclostephanos tholiformis TaxID=382380 RepID=A0ABD3SD49_9STRA